MSLLIESIKIFNGRIYNLRRHENRMTRSRVALLSQDIPTIKLRRLIEVPTHLRSGLVKCRIVYAEKVEKVTFSRYQPKEIRSLKLVEDKTIDYSHKLLDRNLINKLYCKRGNCNDIIIVKNGMLTDSSYSNIALLRNGIWYTPSTCLLKGTRRQQLIDQGRLVETEIAALDINQFDKLCLINSMMGLNQVVIDISSIETAV